MSIGRNVYNINTILSNTVVSTATDADIENSCPISLEKYQLADKSESENAIFIGSCTLQENNLQGKKLKKLNLKILE